MGKFSKILASCLSVPILIAVIFFLNVDVGLFSKPVSAQSAPSVPPERVVDRLGLALTGKLPTSSLRQSYVSGAKSAAEVVDELVKSDDFIMTSARFWLSKMKISGVVDFENIMTIDGKTVLQALTPDIRTIKSRSLEWINSNFSSTSVPPGNSGVVLSGYFRLASDFEVTLANVADDSDLILRVANKSKVDCQLQVREFVRNNGRICPTPYNKFDVSATSQATPTQKSTCLIPAVTAADIAANIVTNPWFGSSPSTQTLVCPGVVERCGSQLENCFPSANFQGNQSVYNGPVNVLLPNLREDFTLEPGVLVAS
ncbi:MAG: hypothetical protein RIR26_2589, partial [Pseudomonadota bacterium]